MILLSLSRRTGERRSGMTLVECMAALAMLAVVGASLMLATQASVESSNQALDETLARGIAAQYLDEALGLPFADPQATAGDPNNVLSDPLGTKVSGGPRSVWSDLDDFAGAQDGDHRTPRVESPLVDPWGHPLGTGGSSAVVDRHPGFALPADYFAGWQVETNVFYVADASSFAPQDAPTYYRMLEVQVFRSRPDGSRMILAELRRAVIHVPKSN